MNSRLLASLSFIALVVTASGCSTFWNSDTTAAEQQRLRDPAALAAADPAVLTPEELAIREARQERDEEIRSIGSQLSAERDRRTSAFDDEIRGPVFVEVLWKVPAEEVSAFRLHYGTNPGDLSKNIRVPVEKLERFSHPLYGPTFRYRLYGMSPKQTTYVSLQAENANGISPRSPVLKIPPLQDLRSRNPS